MSPSANQIVTLNNVNFLQFIVPCFTPSIIDDHSFTFVSVCHCSQTGNDSMAAKTPVITLFTIQYNYIVHDRLRLKEMRGQSRALWNALA